MSLSHLIIDEIKWRVWLYIQDEYIIINNVSGLLHDLHQGPTEDGVWGHLLFAARSWLKTAKPSLPAVVQISKENSSKYREWKKGGCP